MINKNFNINIICKFLILFFPISLLISSGVMEVNIIILIIFYLINCFINKDFNFLKDKYFILLSILWIFLIINCIFSQNFNLSFSRSFFFFKYILLIYAINFVICDRKKLNYIILFWSIVLLIVGFDIFFEYFNKKNIIGFHSPTDPTRIASFLGKELKIGHFVLGFLFLSTGYYFEKFNKKSAYYKISGYILLFFLILAIILTGERSNTIKSLICFFLFITFSKEKLIKYKKTTIILIISLLCLSYSISDRLKFRFDTYYKPIKEVGLMNTIKLIKHGAHYHTAIEIFKAYPVFGVGNKNFREECNNEKYFDSSYSYAAERCSTHPHQIYLELLSEHGIVGFVAILSVIFYILYKSFIIFLKKLNLIHLGSIVFVASTFMPIIPSGSFFTSWGAAIFWVNFAIMISYNNK
jgi:O-antigen ligase